MGTDELEMRKHEAETRGWEYREEAKEPVHRFRRLQCGQMTGFTSSGSVYGGAEGIESWKRELDIFDRERDQMLRGG